MFVTRALAATAVAGLAFGLSAPIAFAAETTPASSTLVSGYCDHHGDSGHGDPGMGGGRGQGGRDQGGSDQGGRDQGGSDQGGSNQGGRDDNRASDQAFTTEQSGDWGGHGDHGDHGKHCRPSHGANTGLGGSITGVNTEQTALGGGLLATAVAGGAVYLKRRRIGSNV